MRSFVVICIVVGCVLFSAASAQQNYDGRNGPHQFGTPGNGIYIRGQNEGPYNVPGVGGTFQNSPSSGRHEYTDEHGNTYYHSPSPSPSGASTTKDLAWAITSFFSVIWVILINYGF